MAFNFASGRNFIEMLANTVLTQLECFVQYLSN